MYGQGNYGPPMGQGPYTSSMFHQRPAAPVLRPFSQSSQTARPITFQHGPQPVPPQVGQVGYPSYQHTPAGSHQSGPALPVPSSGVNTQPYLTTAPPVPPLPPPPPTQPLQVHGSSQMPQHSQWAQNAHIIPPTVPSVALTVLPPPPSQGQTLYGSQAYQPSLSVVQAHPPSHQPASRFFISPPVGAFGHSVLQHSNILAPGPPPPPPPPLPTSPSGAPPLPLSSPPPTSSSIFSNSHMRRPNPTVFDSAFHSQNGSEIDRSVYGSVHEVSASCLVGDDGKHDGSGKCDGESGSKMGSSCVDNLILDLPTPPPKPVDDRTVHKIEVLCQFIAKNGPEFEDMTCQREFGNPEFKFLFGGEPGSQNAVAHEYFIWMKNKCLMAFKSAGKLVTIASPMRLSEDSSYQLNISTNTGVPSSPVDSDMDMEDDITHPEEELQIYPSNNLSHEVVSVSNDLDMKDESRISCSQEHCLGKDALDGNSTCYGSSGLEEQRQDFRTSSDQNQSIMKKSVAKADGLVLNSSRNVEKPSDSNIQGSFSLHEHLSQQNTSTDLEETRLEKLPDQPVKGASPFRLLQDYASEGSSENEAHVEDAAPSTVTASIGGHSRTLDTVAADNSGPDLRPKSLLGSDKDCELLSESCKFQDFPFKSPAVIMEAGMASSTGKLENFVDDIYSNQGSVRDGISHGEHTEKTASTDANVDASVDKKEGIMSMPTTLKVDEFGRLIREGASDSDSGGSPHYTRRRGKRNRSRSRSRSPHDRRRRRSPWRRKERRGRSRSFSPKRCRSRSKSPARGDGEYPGDKMRRDKGQHPECFGFRRGKCYRGSSCRYLHHEDKNHRSRSYRSKQQLQDLLPSSRRSAVYEKNDTAPDKKLSHQHDECRIQGQKPLEHMPGLEERKILGEPAADLTESPVLQNPYADASKLPSKAAYSMPSAVGCLEPEQSRGHYSDKVFQNLDQQHEKTDNSSASETSPVRTSASAPSQLPDEKSPLNKDSIGDAYTGLSSMNKPDNISSHSMVPQESIPTAPEGISHLPPSSFPLLSQETSASHAQQVPNALHSASVGNYPVYQAPISYPHSQYALPPNPSWNSLPPPPALPHPPCPLPVNDTAESLTHGQHSGRPVHFQQIILPSENNFLAQTSSGPCITEFPTVSHVGRNQAYPLMQEPSRPSHLSDDLRSRTFPMSQTIGQVHGGPGLVGEDRFTGRTLQALYPSNDNTPKNFYSQALPFPRELASKRGHGFPAENLPPAELSTPSSQSHSHLQQPSYGLRYPAADSISSLPGDDRNVSSTLSRYTSDLLDRNQHSRMSDFGGSRISNHYNPYASTFEQPLSSKFGSNILLQEKERQYGSNFGAAYSFSDVPVGRADASLGSGYMISPQNSVRGAEGILPSLIGDQYDPLYDSIEPSSNSIRKSVQKLEATDESDVMIRFSGSNKPLDVEDNKKQKGGGTIGITASIEDEEYGETADAEVGAVEDGSPSSTNDAEDAAAGEVEIDQVKAPGKSKKNKDSRSMKLFKVALANFVKEVLKPSWRQGNMSKEAFKTIVKKTVDKVSGAMKSHHIPKSQSKINHYIDSSQRKLTKLVMGYVDKYVKV